jgi:hypothetical protein
MPDTNELFTPFVRDAAALVFEPSTSVRHRGARRRQRRRVVIATCAVLAVAGITATSAWGLRQQGAGPNVATTSSPTPQPTLPSATPSEPPASPTPSATPSTTSAPSGTTPIPREALLRPADVGTGYTGEPYEGDDHGAIGMMLAYCGQSSGAAPEHRLLTDKWSINRGEGVYVFEDVSRYKPGWAAQHMRDLRAAAPRCPTIDVGGNPDNRETFTVVAVDFAGTGSILIRVVGKDETEYLAVVQQGDVEARLRIHNGSTQAQARAIAVKAAERLCAATPTC